MNTTGIEKDLLKKTLQKKVYKRSFSEVVKGFEQKFKDFSPQQNYFSLEKYLSSGSGLAGAKLGLIKDGWVKKEWLRELKTKGERIKEDFKGLYVFLNKNTPFYVGISKCVIGRLLNHVKGHSHHTSTLAYNAALLNYELKQNKKYTGTRKSFNFKEEVTPVKEFLMKQNVAVFPVEDDDELYLFEIFCAMKLQTWLNKFETH